MEQVLNLIVNIYSEIEKKKIIPNKKIMVTCLPDGNFKENSYCRKTEKSFQR